MWFQRWAGGSEVKSTRRPVSWCWVRGSEKLEREIIVAEGWRGLERERKQLWREMDSIVLGYSREIAGVSSDRGVERERGRLGWREMEIDLSPALLVLDPWSLCACTAKLVRSCTTPPKLNSATLKTLQGFHGIPMIWANGKLRKFRFIRTNNSLWWELPLKGAVWGV